MIQQRSEEWFIQRLGKVTASRLYDAIARNKKGDFYASREDYMSELLAERISMIPMPGFSTPAMQWGIDNEEFARSVFSEITGLDVVESGFADHPSIKYVGASPDGLVGDNALLEIKCPHTKKHINTIITKEVDPQYIYQMHLQMICTGRRLCYFMSYDPRLGSELSSLIMEFPFDPVLGATIEQELDLFLSEMDRKAKLVLLDYPRALEDYKSNWSL